jgi:feruloyl esterase
VTGSQPVRFPIAGPNGYGIMPYYGNGFVRYFIARDPHFNPLKFRLPDFADRARQISELLDSTNPDLSAFAARGGKLIVKTNTADFGPSPFQAINYYKSVVATIGQQRAEESIRLYAAPGANHGGAIVSVTTREPMPSTVDLLGVLDQWVETGTPPDTLTLVDQEKQAPFTVLSSRPMCRYPLYPRYDGHGDPKQASSFACARQ